ncbi:helix-turn-helix transcriptional regulator [Paenibacillus sp. PAMC21692]|uniref:helix-turn-helix domain-containing protein n=1 Tax=Paenibacillus sp. PAMC21692 TaxID=2762320 RepID=UPI00164E708A|nr:helix-turn-helix domain-containing protein [Paenibacillus sp. PAMC21692]QNK54541.1 helix-turn-helix domain-containing protein [Paenibacillus sp. PAMC21692]
MSLIPSYRPLEVTLVNKNKLKKHLRDEANISGTTLAKMSNGEFVSLSVIARICEYLECKIQDVVEFTTEEDESVKTLKERLDSLSEEEFEALQRIYEMVHNKKANK